MFEHNDHVGRRPVGIAARNLGNAWRVGVIAAAFTLIGAIDLPPLPLVGIDLGATPAFAKNDRNSDRERGGRGRGHDRRSARADAQQADGDRRIWNRPGDRDHADSGRHSGHRGSGAERAERSDRRSAMGQPPLPPRRPDPQQGDFRNHGQRVSTYVALAKELGFSASAGSMQANFGTPFENGLVATDPDTGEFLKDPDTGEFIIDATEAEIAAVKPGNGPKTGWETETDLDVNMDGVVDGTDLDLAQDPGATSNGDGGGEVDRQDDDGQDDDHDDGDGQAAILRLGREDGAESL